MNISRIITTAFIFLLSVTLSCAKEADYNKKPQASRDNAGDHGLDGKNDLVPQEQTSNATEEGDFLSFFLSEDADTDAEKETTEDVDQKKKEAQKKHKKKFRKRLKATSAALIAKLDKDRDSALNQAELSSLLATFFKFIEMKKLSKRNFNGKKAAQIKDLADKFDNKSKKDNSHLFQMARKCLDKDENGVISYEEIKDLNGAKECINAYKASGH